MISQRCRHQGRGSVFNRVFTSSIERCAAARVTLAISSFFCFETTPLLFYHGMRIGIRSRSRPAKRISPTRAFSTNWHGWNVRNERSGALVTHAHNVIAVGAPGVGKSHLAAALGHELIRA